MSSYNKPFGSGGRRKDYAAQSPKDSNESVDELLANVDQFIEGVYRDLDIHPPRRYTIGNTDNLNTRSPDRDSSFSSSTSTPSDDATLTSGTTFSSKSTHVKSPSTRRNMDAEIERINRICENVDQHLRSVGLDVNNSPPNSTSENLLNTNSISQPASSTSVIILNHTSPPLSTIIRKYNSENNPQGCRSPPITEVVDLSNSQTEMPVMARQSIPHSNDEDEDDDVILVSADIPSIVNLCTPSSDHETLRSRSPINYKQLNRRRLCEHNAGDTCCGGPSLPRKYRNSYTPSEYNKPSYNDSFHTENSSNIGTSSSKNGEGPTRFLCPVCMESCLQRYPTSTLCGHVFCKQCIEQAIALTRKCPLCNKKMTKKQTFRIYV